MPGTSTTRTTSPEKTTSCLYSDAALVHSADVREPPGVYALKRSPAFAIGITKSGLGVSKPFGSLSLDYGQFGTVGESFSYGMGGKKWGNFIAVNGLNTGRFLDPPEFTIILSAGRPRQCRMAWRIGYEFGAQFVD